MTWNYGVGFRVAFRLLQYAAVLVGTPLLCTVLHALRSEQLLHRAIFVQESMSFESFLELMLRSLCGGL